MYTKFIEYKMKGFASEVLLTKARSPNNLSPATIIMYDCFGLLVPVSEPIGICIRWNYGIH